jgi:acetyltransferase-like isoleucine patch superfamily enzyme
MNNDLPESYRKAIQSRTTWHYFKGWLIRGWTNLKYALARGIARRNGATIGEAVVLPLSLARKANKNLIVGSHVCIQTDKLDLRNPIHIGSYVIIGADVEILTTSHNIDSSSFEQKDYGITIDDYVWIPSKVLILPSCRQIELGAVVSAGSVVVQDVETMSVVGGNPAKEFKKRRTLHKDLVVESLLGGDFKVYWEARK